jgi:hypothetical protein
MPIDLGDFKAGNISKDTGFEGAAFFFAYI